MNIYKWHCVTWNLLLYFLYCILNNYVVLMWCCGTWFIAELSPYISLLWITRAFMSAADAQSRWEVSPWRWCCLWSQPPEQCWRARGWWTRRRHHRSAESLVLSVFLLSLLALFPHWSVRRFLPHCRDHEWSFSVETVLNFQGHI